MSEKHCQIYILSLLLMGVDYAAIIGAEYLSLLSRKLPCFKVGEFMLDFVNFWVVIPALFIFVFFLEGLYVRRTQFWQIMVQLCKGCTYAVLAGILFLYLAHASEASSRLFVGFLWLWSLLLVNLFRYVFGKFLLHVSFLQLPVIILGAGPKAALLAQAIAHDEGLGYKVVGLISDSPVVEPALQGYPHLGGMDKIEKILGFWDATVMVATEGMELESFKDMVFRVQALARRVCLVPDFTGIPMGDLRVESFFMEKLLVVETGNNLANPWNLLVKNVLEYIFTAVGTLCLLPAFLVISAMIYLEDPGPVIYTHWRIGKGGKPFPCYKFRSMVVNSQQVLEELLAHDQGALREWEANFKLKDDPRITKLGAVLRRTSLDELPQLFNVLKGEMSLVGPRPVLQEELDKYYQGYVSDYLSVKPGITGMWQVSGRSDLDYKERVELDRWYVRNWSIWIDIMLLWRTVKVVFLGRGAY